MTIATTRLRRATTLGAGLTLTAVLAACSGGSGAEVPSTGTKNPSTAASQAPSGPEITNPKNAAAVDPCSLLLPEAAAALGVNPQGEQESNDINPDLPPSCVWESPGDGLTKVSLAPIPDRSIQVYYKNKSQYVDYKELTVKGYPVVRVNKINPMESGSCGMFLAAKENQVVQSFTAVPAKDTGKVDPCGLAKKALKLSLPTWPAAK